MKILHPKAFLSGESSSPHTTLNSTNQGDDAVLLDSLVSIGFSDPPLSWAAGLRTEAPIGRAELKGSALQN